MNLIFIENRLKILPKTQAPLRGNDVPPHVFSNVRGLRNPWSAQGRRQPIGTTKTPSA